MGDGGLRDPPHLTPCIEDADGQIIFIKIHKNGFIKPTGLILCVQGDNRRQTIHHQEQRAPQNPSHRIVRFRIKRPFLFGNT